MRKGAGRPKIYQINEAAFDEFTPDACYWAGFMFADGGISRRPGRGAEIRLSTSIVDAEHIDKFRTFLKSTHPIRISAFKPSALISVGTPRASLSIYNQSLATRLEALGMANSALGYRFAAPDLASSPDFWRGVIDGDGTLAIFKRGDSALQLCGNRELTEQWLAFVRRRFPEYRGQLVKMKTIFYVRVNGRIAHTLVNELYNNDRISLDRKKAVALEILSRPMPKVHTPSPKVDLPDTLIQEIVDRYQAGEGLVTLGRAYGIPHHILYNRFGRMGIARRSHSEATRLAASRQKKG